MKLGLTAMLTLLLVVLAACGGDDDDSAGDSDDQATNTASATLDGEATDEPGDQETTAPEATDPPENGGDDDGNNGGNVGGIDSCSLITPEQAEEAVGAALREPERSQIGENFDQCVWTRQDDTTGIPSLVIQARADTSGDKYAELVDENCPEALGPANPVDGVGDQAFECLALMVLEGDTMVVVTVLNSDPDGGTARQEELAKLAIGRLP